MDTARSRLDRRVLIAVIAAAVLGLSRAATAQITQIIDHRGDGTHPLDGPSGIAVDGSGRVYVLGAGSNNAFRITPGGTITQIIDSSGDGTHALFSPLDIAVDGGGTVYVSGRDGAASQSGGNAFRISAAGTITRIIDSSGDGIHALNGSTRIAVDETGNVYVTGFLSNNAFRVTPGGTITQIIDSSGDGTIGHAFGLPSGIAVDRSGDVCVLSGLPNAFRITPAGTITQIIDSSGDGIHPFGLNTVDIAADRNGNCYVTGFQSFNAFKITAAGAITQLIDGTGDGMHALVQPTGIAVDGGGNVYVAGSTNAFRVSSEGGINQIIDSTGDGTHPYGSFPNFIAADENGNVYVTSLRDGNVFKIPGTAPGTPTPTATPTPPPNGCAGDCDDSGAVAINELVTMVTIALGSADVSACAAGDSNGDGAIAINDLVAAVNKALDGC